VGFDLSILSIGTAARTKSNYLLGYEDECRIKSYELPFGNSIRTLEGQHGSIAPN